MSPLRWTCRSLSQLAQALTLSASLPPRLRFEGTQACFARGHRVGRTLVGELLHAQFRRLNEGVCAALVAGEPVISVDTKKELVADFRNPGREWRPRGAPEEVLVHDFLVNELVRAVPNLIVTSHPTQSGSASS